MGAMTDPSTEAGSTDGGQVQVDELHAPGLTHGRQARRADGAAGWMDAGKAHGKRADHEHLGTSHIHRGASTGIFRGHSGGLLRGMSGGIHLPKLESITFEMTRLPEEDAGVQRRFTETKEFGALRFTYFQAYRYLVAVNVVVFVYSTLQFIHLMVTVILGVSFIPSVMIGTWMTFGFDQLFSYLLLSASTSAATVANMSYTGEMGPLLCSRYLLCKGRCCCNHKAFPLSWPCFLPPFLPFIALLCCSRNADE